MTLRVGLGGQCVRRIPWRWRRREGRPSGQRERAPGGSGDIEFHAGPDRYGATPRQRRATVEQILEQALIDEGIPYASDHSVTETVIAIASDDRRRLLGALRSLAHEHQRLDVRAGRLSTTVARSSAAEVDSTTIDAATWIDVGVPFRARDYRIGREGFIRLVFVAWDPTAERLIAEHGRSLRADWTGFLRLPDPPEDRQANGVDSIPAPEMNRRRLGPIDVVYTWVDATDPDWRHRYERAAGSAPPTLPSAGTIERFADRDELRYSLRALEAFAPFVNHVYLVTAQQQPSWLDESNSRLTVIDHQDIFPDPTDLPTFNSHAIEACLHRIPGLSERYLYFNDDVFLGREASPFDFFTMGGLPKVRFGTSPVFEGPPAESAIPTDWAAYNAASLVLRDFGLKVPRKLKHVPFALRRSMVEELEDRYAREFRLTRAARFRSRSDIAVPSMLAPFAALAMGEAVEWPDDVEEYVYADSGRQDWSDRCERIRRRRPHFYCLNSTRLQDIPLEEQSHRVASLLEAVLPFPSSFEQQ